MSTLPTSPGAFLIAALGVTLLAGCGDGKPAPSNAAGAPAPAGTASSTPAAAEPEPMNEIVSRYHVVASVYDAPSKVLSIRLASGVYQYAAVPKDVAERFAATKERDDLFLKEINGRYAETHVPASSPLIKTLGL